MQNASQLSECWRHINVSNYVFDPCVVLLASKAPLLAFCLWPSGAIIHGGPSSHSSSLSALHSFSQRRFLGQIAWTSVAPFLQIYWLTANLSIIHIPNYRFRPARWQQQNKRIRGEKTCCPSSASPHLPLDPNVLSCGCAEWISAHVQRISKSKSLRVRCVITPTSLSVKCSTIKTGWLDGWRKKTMAR